MRVLDASVVVDALARRGPRGERAYRALLGSELVAPAHIDIESIAGWRRHARLGELSIADAEDAIRLLRALPVRRIPHEPLLDRIWELRENVTTADAAYVALAERLNAPLLTTDARLTRASGPRCEFLLIE